MKKRIWELDALRGLCILGMLVVHFLYDATVLYGLLQWEVPLWFSALQNWGGTAFLLISGICVTLGSQCVKRGFLVFSCGMLCTTVTALLFRLGFADSSILIYFGILHCLGVSMMLWKGFGKLPTWALALLGLLWVGLGLYLNGLRLSFDWLCSLGLVSAAFASADYFPLLPNFGFFLLGAVLGRTLYARKTTRFPLPIADSLPIRFLRLCGRHSLWIYLAHQPVLTGLFWILS